MQKISKHIHMYVMLQYITNFFTKLNHFIRLHRIFIYNRVTFIAIYFKVIRQLNKYDHNRIH